MKPVCLGIVMLFSNLATAQPQSAPQKHEPPKGMKNYFLAFLVKGEKRDVRRAKEELEQLQRQHLAYIRSQADAGKYVLAGPLLDEDRIRGILVINAESAESAQAIANGDPAVKAGRLAVEIHPIMLGDLACVLTEYRKNGGA